MFTVKIFLSVTKKTILIFWFLVSMKKNVKLKLKLKMETT